ncbi:MAG: ABC transporter permease [Bordetella sp.]|uniref:ABC transporter permease n=1 Tax=Bordetella sp. TaxID=28081 RepID=UPI003F7C0B71
MSTIEKHTIVISSSNTHSRYFHDLWSYRDLLFFLSWRDILVRYKQTVIGIAWAVVRPLLTMLIFSFVFGRIAKLPSSGTAYPLMVFSAMLPWYFFAGALTDSSNSLLVNSNMISKVYFPRLLIPASTIAVSLVDLGISLVIMLGLMAWYGVWPTFRILTLIPLIVIAITAALGLGLWFAALNVRYRDFRYIVPFITQIGLYVSPVGFSSTVIPEHWRLAYSINPMVSVIDGFRWALLGTNTDLYFPGIILSLAVIFILLASGIWYFRRTENTFADEI